MMKHLLSKEHIAAMVLEEAIENMQRYVLQMEMTQYAVSPEDALGYIQQGLADAAKLAEGLSSRNFVPEEIHRQRRAIRKAMRTADETEITHDADEEGQDAS
jgi:hypothetical protein